jgi:uncharacterized protein YjbI with pentapeptide repeats
MRPTTHNSGDFKFPAATQKTVDLGSPALFRLSASTPQAAGGADIKMPLQSGSAATAAAPRMQTEEKFTVRELFIHAFKKEFVRELGFVCDVASGRATAKKTFISKLADAFKTADAIPVVGSTVAKLGSAVGAATNTLRDETMRELAAVTAPLDMKRVDYLSDVVAHEAYRRDEFFILNRLVDDAENVIAFVRVGVTRVLNHLARKRCTMTPEQWVRKKLDLKIDAKTPTIELSESLLLAGLIEGESGAGVNDWTNTRIKIKKTPMSPVSTIDAETVYAHSGMMHFAVTDNQFQLQLYTRTKGVEHRQSKTHLNDPKAGYVVMPPHLITHYGFEQQTQDNKLISSELQGELTVNQHLQTVVIDKATLKKYIAWSKTAGNAQKTIAHYLKEQGIWKGAKWVECHDDLSDLPLAGVNLSEIDLSGSTFGGDLTATQFMRSRLYACHFKKGTVATRTNFYQAICAYAVADGVTFIDANLIQSEWSFGSLQAATLTRCQRDGAIWYQTKLQNIIGDDTLLKDQAVQVEQLQLEMTALRAELQRLNLQQDAQHAQLQQLAKDVDQKIQIENAKQSKILEEKFTTIIDDKCQTLDAKHQETFKKIFAEMKDSKESADQKIQTLEKHIEKQIDQATAPLKKDITAVMEQFKKEVAQTTKDRRELQTVSRQVHELIQQHEARHTFERFCRDKMHDLETRLEQKADATDVKGIQQQLQKLQREWQALDERTQAHMQQTLQMVTTTLQQLGADFSALQKALLHGHNQLHDQIHILSCEINARCLTVEGRVTRLEDDITDLKKLLSPTAPSASLHSVKELALIVKNNMDSDLKRQEAEKALISAVSFEPTSVMWNPQRQRFVRYSLTYCNAI